MQNLSRIINKVRSTSRTLYILCGYPYAGKSYIARQILKETEAVFISIDDIFHARGFDWNMNKLPNAEEWQTIFDESYILAKEALGKGKNVLYDSTNQTVASRGKLRRVAESVGADACVIFVKSDEATIWKRWEGNLSRLNRPVVDRGLVAETITSFEVPTEKENVLVILN